MNCGADNFLCSLILKMENRQEVKYENLSTKFLLKTFDYQKQFCHLYAHRLAEMNSLLKPLVEKRWGSKYLVKKLCNLREEQNETCVIIGTIYKHQANKPSILREISEENQLAPQPARMHYADPEDKLVLEDELQRVRLQGNIDIRLMATGVVCAALGCIEEDGRFIVDEFLFYEGGPQKSLMNDNTNSKFIVLISGLDQMHTELNFVDELNLFQFWLGGSLKTSMDKKCKPVRLIVAGNSVNTSSKDNAIDITPSNMVKAISSLDDWFSSWATTVAVDVMPGPHDPSNFMLPQQPFHRCMFPKASLGTSFQSVSNPYVCTINNVNILGTSGQNIQDLLRTTMLEKPIDALRSTLKWSHIAPTAPDTLACYPYIENDPLVIRECPHIYFAGNCSEFATEIHTGTDGQKTRLVCVPDFSKTKSIAVVNLDTFDCKQICFDTKSD